MFQDDQLIGKDLDSIAETVLKKRYAEDIPEVVVSTPSDQMLSSTETAHTVA